MNLNSIWSVLEDAFDLLGGYGFAAMDKAATQMELKPGWMTWIAAIWLFGSEPITIANFMRMLPYGLAHLNEERFASAVRQGYLISDGQHGYAPTEAGMRAAQKVWREAGDSLARLNPMPEAPLRKIFDYLARLGEASMSAPEPPPHFFISHKRENYQRFQVLYLLERFVVLFGELAAYRDDSHIATWEAQDIEGHTWEVLTYLWRGQTAASADTLFEKLGYRNIPREVFVQDLRDLESRGWAQEEAGEYRIAAEGKQIRDEAEALTNRYFFAPWSRLSEAELEDVLNLATQLRDGLKGVKQ
ncbi:MAG: hypothetical protein AAB217_22095 [Chloroflexota bacterium]